MKTRILSLCLAGAMLLSTGVTAAAARVGSDQPKSAVSHEWAVTPVYETLSFDQIDRRVRANNLTVQSMEETIASMEAVNWDKAISELEDSIDELEDQIDQMKSSLSIISTVKAGLSSAFDALATPVIPPIGPDGGTDSGTAGGTGTGIGKNITDGIEALAQLTYMDFSVKSLESTLESAEDQLDDLKDQKKDYIKKTLPDAKRQTSSHIDQIVSGAESVYLAILSTQLQGKALEEGMAALDRTVAEMELRYERGQISRLTLTQVKNGVGALKSNAASLDVAMTSLYSSLQSLLGEPITGEMNLAALPAVTADDVAALSYSRDLEKAKEASYDLYAAARTVEDAEEDMEDARKEEGKNSYQYKVAQHTYESAVLSQKSAVQSFEVSFRNLYNQLTPALVKYTTAETDLEYETQVYQAQELKYQLGNLSANALTDARDTLESARRDLESARMDLFTAWHNYQNAVTRGIVTSGS